MYIKPEFLSGNSLILSRIYDTTLARSLQLLYPGTPKQYAAAAYHMAGLLVITGDSA
jgi:hypothetical protein